MHQSILPSYKLIRLLSNNCFLVAHSSDSPNWSGSSTFNKALSIILVLAILAVISVIVYLVVTPYTGEKFTEFYILGPEGKAENYPKTLNSGEEASIILGIVNHEYEEVTYQVKIFISGNKIKEVGPIALANQAKWEEKISFIPIVIGKNQKVECILYKTGQDDAYLTLNLWIDVHSP
jgi:uncharacterized membrane protein